MKNIKILGVAAVAAAALMAFVGNAAATTLTSPAGTAYTGEIKAEAGTTELHGPFVTFSCLNSTMTGQIEAHGPSVTAGGRLSKWTFTGCSHLFTVLKAGSLELHALGNGNATLTSSGAEITIQTSIANCIFTTANTHIGTLTGGTPAKLDIGSAAMPRTGHSFFCGSSATWTGSYTFTTPSTLLID